MIIFEFCSVYLCRELIVTYLDLEITGQLPGSLYVECTCICQRCKISGFETGRLLLVLLCNLVMSRRNSKAYSGVNPDKVNAGRGPGSDSRSGSVSGTPPASPRVGISGQRRILERRQKLHEFYKLTPPMDQGATFEGLSPAQQVASPQADDLDHDFFGSQEEFAKLVATRPIGEILKRRNAASARLDAHDLAKKGMIYDNYYQLIQLSDTLGELTEKKIPAVPHPGHSDLVGLDDLEMVIKDLANFAERDIQSFDRPFSELFPTENVDTENPSPIPSSAIPEINTLLNVSPCDLTKEQRLSLVSQVETISKKCPPDSLLAIQLQGIESDMTA